MILTQQACTAIVQIIFEGSDPLHNHLYRLALAVTRKELDAEDAVEAAVEKMCERAVAEEKPMQEPIIEDEVTTWLYAQVFFAAKNGLRKDRRRKTHPLSMLSVADLDAIMARNDPSLEWIIRRDMLEVAFRQLTKRERGCLYLRNVEGMTYAEIATALEISSDIVGQNLSRARRKLKTLLEGETGD